MREKKGEGEEREGVCETDRETEEGRRKEVRRKWIK